MADDSGKNALAELSSLGHFLKGSSAALGIIKVQASCEKMQHYGNKRDEEEGVDLKEGENQAKKPLEMTGGASSARRYLFWL